uniref:Uncharacterized protein n=1 Tax=uncultured nuHF2 cluster bacterium HF0500_39O04 TaxID=723590 RepID=E7C6A0_9BACT|nr:hypothetical protein [uncultured nuHF2 cluster bacterium HF0500_39O04]
MRTVFRKGQKMKANIIWFLKYWPIYACLSFIPNFEMISQFSDFEIVDLLSLDRSDGVDLLVLWVAFLGAVHGLVFTSVHFICRAIWRKLRSRFTATMLCTAICFGLLPWYLPNSLARDQVSRIQADIGFSLILIVLCLLILGIGRFGIWVRSKFRSAPS